VDFDGLHFNRKTVVDGKHCPIDVSNELVKIFLDIMHCTILDQIVTGSIVVSKYAITK
jgi:hypothetical protein